MDLNSVREQAIEATTRFLFEKHGVVPDQDSEEWEDEYRRQFEQVKKRAATAPPDAAKPAAAAAIDDTGLPELVGQPTQLRWAAGLRADRLKEIKDREIRDWLIRTWTRSKSWIDTSSLPTPVFLQRIQPHFAEYRRKQQEQAQVLAAERQAKQAAAAEIRRQIEAGGITAEGLIELIDAAERLPAAPIKGKIAEIEFDGRNLRVFETSDEITLMVLEKNGEGRSEYGIERDEGLVADLVLYAQAQALS